MPSSQNPDSIRRLFLHKTNRDVSASQRKYFMSHFVLILSLAIYVIRPGEWMPGPEIRWNLILNVIGALVIVSTAQSGKAGGAADRTWLFLVGFLLWMILSNVLQLQFDAIGIYFTEILTTVVIFMLTFMAVQSERQARSVTFIIGLLVLFVCYQCHLQIANGFNSFGVTAFSRQEGYLESGERLFSSQARWLGVFNDPNDTGMLLLSIAPLAFARSLFAGTSVPMRIYWGFVLIAIVYGTYLTNSRGSYLALLAAIGIFFVVKYRSVIGLILSGVAGFVLLTLGPSRMASITSADGSAMERVYAWILALELFAMNPVLGIGPTYWMDFHHLTPHNSYVLAFVELGFIGYCLYMAVFMTALFVSAQVAIKTDDPSINVSASAMFACMTGVMVSAFFISRTYVLLPFFMAALVTSYSRALAPDIYDEAVSTLKLWWIAAAAAASIVMIWITNRLTTQLLL